MADIVIVGGGPVGIFAALELARLNVVVRVFETRATPTTHSRAIGIHPPALALFDAIGLGERMRGAGVLIDEGIVRSRGATRARLPLSGGGGVSGGAADPHPPVLALPQHVTERMLRAELLRLAPGALVTGCPVRAVRMDKTAVIVVTDRGEETAAFLIAADGAAGVMRTALGAVMQARDYPDRYLMGDFADTTGEGSAAVIHLEPGGVIESFPLPGGLRRWVAHTGTDVTDASPALLARLVAERTGVELDETGNAMISAFGVRRRLVEHPVSARTALIGDAAHEISPIGGQGMSLGWLDAADLAPVLAAAIREHRPLTAAEVADLNRMLHRRAVAAARRAEFDMAMGRPRSGIALAARDLLVRLALTPPLRRRTAASMTMGGL